jgi:hypothetical protein
MTLAGAHSAGSRSKTPAAPAMPNVPVIGLRIGPVSFPTQVDTGYGDFPRGVVQVNAALMKIFSESGMPMRPVPSDVVTVGCSGSYTYARWQIERGEVSIITPGGNIVASYALPLLEVKTDARCNGISTFAQIALPGCRGGVRPCSMV